MRIDNGRRGFLTQFVKASGGILGCSSANAKPVIRLRDRPFVIYYYANSLKYFAAELNKISDAQIMSWPGVGVVYFRLPWCMLNPRENYYDWSLLDGPCRRFAGLGLSLAFRVSCSENRYVWRSATPAWVFEAGAKYNKFASVDGDEAGKRSENLEPDFADPIFMKYHEIFLEAFSKYLSGMGGYIEFVDVGSFGVYGEGHTVSSSKIPYSAEQVIAHLAMAKRALGRFTLLANHNFADSLVSKRDLSPLYVAAEMGMGFRDDSIFVDPARPFYDSDIASKLFNRKMVLLETADLGTADRVGKWKDDVYLRAIGEYGATHLGVHGYPSYFFKEKMPLVQRILSYARDSRD